MHPDETRGGRDKRLISDELGMRTGNNIPSQVHERFEGRDGAVVQTGGVPAPHFQRQNALILTRQEVAHGDL